jgi:CMP-N-acetylneuraminic acid synthetase
MRVLAVILARGGSKGIKGKNILEIGGVPLIGRTIRACLACREISDVIVSTDDTEIARIASEYGSLVVDRPPEYATDSSSSESALLQACEAWKATAGHMYDLLMLVQNTTPFHSPSDMTAVIEAMANGKCNSCITVAETWRYHWTECGDGWEMPYQERANRQNRKPWFVEAGSLYCVRYEQFCKTMNLFTPPVETVIVPEWRSIELDDPEDIVKVRALAGVYDLPHDTTLDIKNSSERS